MGNRMTKRVFIYWNLHRDIYSVRRSRGPVTAYVPAIRLTHASFTVSEAGRQRVLATGHKNVHAGVRADWGGRSTLRRPPALSSLRGWRRVTYNPHKYDSFVAASDGSPVIGAEEVWLVTVDGKPRIYARGLEYREERMAA